MTTHKFNRWMIIVLLLFTGNFMLGQIVSGLLQPQNINKAITLSEPFSPIASLAKAAPLKQLNSITPTMSLEIRERYQADVEAARLNEAIKLTCRNQ